MMYIRPLDERGWLVPKVGTKFREVYTMLCHGLRPSEMMVFLPGTNIGNIRQMVFRIRNPTYMAKPRPVWHMISQAKPLVTPSVLPAMPV
jgi:hypothetical protein